MLLLNYLLFAFIFTQGILRAYQYSANDECEQPLSGNVVDPVSQEIVSQSDDVITSPTSQEEVSVVSSEEKIILSSLHIILDTLNEDTPQLVQEVKCVVQELRRITLLWDELWLGSLTQLNQESQRLALSTISCKVKRIFRFCLLLLHLLKQCNAGKK